MPATIEAKEVGPNRFRLLVRTEKVHVYGLCTCPEGHRTAKLAEDCIKAQETAKKYR